MRAPSTRAHPTSDFQKPSQAARGVRWARRKSTGTLVTRTATCECTCYMGGCDRAVPPAVALQMPSANMMMPTTMEFHIHPWPA